jgi:hypothetical protein
MSTAHATAEQPVEFQGFDAPDEVQDLRDTEPHYGCSPVFNINIAGRNVLKGVIEIKAGALVEFNNLEEHTALEPGESTENKRVAETPSGEYAVSQKTARACAEEMRHAYNATNPWGFQVFDCLTGREHRELKRQLFKLVFPRPLPLPQLIDDLEINASVRVLEAQFPDVSINGLTPEECAEEVRRQLLTGAREAQFFSQETLEGSAQEIADRQAGAHGKARYDRRDYKLAGALGVTLKQPIAAEQAKPAPAPQQGIDPAFVMGLVEKVGHLTATVEQMQAEKQKKQPKAKPEGAEE